MPPDLLSQVTQSAFTTSSEQKSESIPHRIAMPKLTSLNYNVVEHTMLNSIQNLTNGKNSTDSFICNECISNIPIQKVTVPELVK